MRREASAAGTEGTVVLDLIVDEKGHARDIHVVSGLAHGLTEAAIAAIKGCHFDPGEKDGKAVPVRVGASKISGSSRPRRSESNRAGPNVAAHPDSLLPTIT